MAKEENPIEKNNKIQACTLLRRFGIMLYDGLLLISVLLFAVVPVLFITGGEAVEADNYFFKTYMLLIVALYYLFPWCRNGQTLAMQTWRVKLVQDSGEKITLAQGVIRLFSSLLSWAVLGLGFLWSLFDKNKRTWHDIISQTKLVHTPKSKSTNS